MPETPNIYISNGTCYYNWGYKADTSMIPCGNDYFAHAACCQANDTCLESNACYNAEYGVTYIAGCTDPVYNSSVCPDKYEDLNSPTWMGMSYCNGTSNEWVLCNQPDDPSTIESPEPCYCPTATSERTMTLSAASAITATAHLPSAVGLEITYVAGHYPTSTASGSATQQATTRSQDIITATAVMTVTAASPPAATSSLAQTTSAPEDLGTNATIGIAVGASIGGVLLLGALCFFLRWLLLRRQEQRKADGTNTREVDEKTPAGSPNLGLATIDAARNEGNGMGQTSQVASPRRSTVSELDNHSARPWSTGPEVNDTGAWRTRSVVSPPRMDSILEQGQEQVEPIELAAIPLVELEG